MKKAFAFALIIFSAPLPALASERADEQLVRPALVGNLIGRIDWLSSEFKSKSDTELLLCVYKDYSIFRQFNKYLSDTQIHGKPLAVKTILERSEISACHYLYVQNPTGSDIAWMTKHASEDKTVLIGEGRGLANSGFHLSLYIGTDDKFSLDLNIDAFNLTGHMPTTELYALANTVESPIVDGANLTRSLLGYTSWPDGEPQSFKLCSYQTGLFSSYLGFLVSQKQIQRKAAEVLPIDSLEQQASCQAVIFFEQDKERLLQSVEQRSMNPTLLIGNFKGSAEMGAHYSLQPVDNSAGRRVEINLHAFESSGHSPNFRLLNSAVLVKRDYYGVSLLVKSALTYTLWPNQKSLTSKEPRILCVLRKNRDYQILRKFLANDDGLQSKVEVRLLDDLAEVRECHALVIKDEAPEAMAPVWEQQKQHPLLIISDSEDGSFLKAHFNIKADPKRLTLERLPKYLQESGFIVVKRLKDKTTISGGRH